MDLLSTTQALGNRITLRTSDPRHIGGAARTTVYGPDKAPPPDPEAGFAKLFLQSLSQVNDMQVRAQDLSRALITDPDSVDIHEVTVALAEANLALSMTKAVIDRAIRAYREIVNIR